MNFFTHKKIDVTFTKGKGNFAESGTNTVKLSGLRVSAMITKAGGVPGCCRYEYLGFVTVENE
jgi:hypothetical protein